MYATYKHRSKTSCHTAAKKSNKFLQQQIASFHNHLSRQLVKLHTQQMNAAEIFAMETCELVIQRNARITYTQICNK